MIYNIIGLSFDLLGVFLLFRFGILPNNLWEHILMDSGMSEKDEKKHKVWSKIAISLILIGFTLQLIGTASQYKTGSKTDNFKNLILGKEKNITSGIVGDLKLKFQNNKLSYQLELVGLTKSFGDITEFGIHLEDYDGFKIAEISESKNEEENHNLSQLHKKDSLFMTIKNTIPFTPKVYSQVNKWNLTISK